MLNNKAEQLVYQTILSQMKQIFVGVTAIKRLTSSACLY